jgi:lipoprotein
MRKQILAVMVGLSVVLSGCSSQSTESVLQEVKKDTKEIKSGKATKVLLKIYEDNNSLDNTVYEKSGDEKFDPLEFVRKGKYKKSDENFEIEEYFKDGVYYSKTDGSWLKKKDPTVNDYALSFKTDSLNMHDGILNLLDNKNNWDVIKDGDKVTFKLKKTDELKTKVKETQQDIIKVKVKFTEFDYNIEYVFNNKTKDVEKLAYELTFKSEGIDYKRIAKGSLEEINKEVKVELPEESKNADEFKS